MRVLGFPIGMLLFVMVLLAILLAVLTWTAWKILFFYGVIEAIPPFTKVVVQ